MPRATPTDFRSTAGSVVVVIVGHVAMIAFLTSARDRGADSPGDERMRLVFVDPLEQTSRAARPEGPTRDSRPMRPLASRALGTARVTRPEDSTALQTPAASIDWYADGSAAAHRATAESTARGIGFPRREPAPREKKPFGWDQTHTDRVHALDGGGIGIHLSDNCELIFAPLPLAGCALGKRKARGDLFDEMKAPVEPGDWKDR